MNDTSELQSGPAARMREAKHPELPVAGPYGYPLHPAVVAVPIGAWLTAFTFDIRSRFGPHGRDDARASRDAMSVGIAGAIAAAGLGFLDWLRLAPGTKARTYGTVHMLLNLGILGFYAGAVRGRAAIVASPDETARVTSAQLASTAAALGILSFSGIIGGELAYRFGVRVADEATQRAAFERRDDGESLPPAFTGGGRP